MAATHPRSMTRRACPSRPGSVDRHRARRSSVPPARSAPADSPPATGQSVVSRRAPTRRGSRAACSNAAQFTVRTRSASARTRATACASATEQRPVRCRHRTCRRFDHGREPPPPICSRASQCRPNDRIHICAWVVEHGWPVCDGPSSVGALERCGTVQCTTPYCRCVSASESTCDCNGPVAGPLSPPDWPVG